MKENYYGFNFKSIPREVIQYKGFLENGDTLVNKYGKEIFWCVSTNSFKLATDDAYDFLSNEDIYSIWKKI